MEFVAIDVETANADMASICQIGIAKYSKGQLIDEWTSLINKVVPFFRVLYYQWIRITGKMPVPLFLTFYRTVNYDGPAKSPKTMLFCWRATLRRGRKSL